MARAKDGLSKSVQVSGKVAEILFEKCDQSGLSGSEFVKLLIISCSDVLMSRLFPDQSQQVMTSHAQSTPVVTSEENQFPPENPPPINLNF